MAKLRKVEKNAKTDDSLPLSFALSLSQTMDQKREQTGKKAIGGKEEEEEEENRRKGKERNRGGREC